MVSTTDATLILPPKITIPICNNGEPIFLDIKFSEGFKINEKRIPKKSAKAAWLSKIDTTRKDKEIK